MPSETFEIDRRTMGTALSMDIANASFMSAASNMESLREIRIRITDNGDKTKIELTPEAQRLSCRRRAISSLLVLLSVAAVAYVSWIYWSSFTDKYRNETIVWLQKYGTIPIVAALVGWGTNALAINMTFYPLEFRGCLPGCSVAGMPLCGWQGIIPQSCEDMARQAVELMTTRLMDVQGVFSKLDPERMTAELRPAIEAITPKLVHTIGSEYFPSMWNKLPRIAQDEVVKKCQDDSAQAITDMMSDANSDMSEVIDMSETIVSLFTRDKQLMNDIFLKCAEYEFWFIRVSGFYLGFLFGLAQMALCSVYPEWWVLPVAGFVVGYLTNFIALKVIFLPVQPTQFCCCTLHGLFLRRQKEVAVVYAQLFSTQVLTAENLLMGIISGPCSDKLFEQLDKSISEGVDVAVRSQRVAKLVIGSEKYNSMKARIGGMIRDDIRVFVKHVTPYLDETFDVKTTLENSMCQLSCEEFEGMLHPVFEEGELKLVLIGGFLGIVVGLIQAWFQIQFDEQK